MLIWQHFKYLAMLTQVGLVIVIPLVGAFFIGSFLQSRFGLPGYITIILALLGLVTGFYNAYKLLSKWWQL